MRASEGSASLSSRRIGTCGTTDLEPEPWCQTSDNLAGVGDGAGDERPDALGTLGELKGTFDETSEKVDGGVCD